MDSYFNPTIRPHVRQAEKTDTRQAISRQDTKDDRRRKSKRSLDELDGNDETVVSIESLRVFLHSLLESGQEQDGTTTSDASKKAYAVPQTQQPAPQRPPMAQRAAQAYQNTYKAAYHPEGDRTDITEGGRETREPGDRENTPKPEAEPVKSLSDKDREVVLDLIDDLDVLLKHDISELTIRRKGDLLQSIIETVAFHKKQLGV